MGNYVLQKAVKKLAQHSNGQAMPRIFDHIFMCAPDVTDDVFEKSNALHRLHEIARNVTVYFNYGDVALHVSDYTKGNPDRLGTAGFARQSCVHSKIHQDMADERLRVICIVPDGRDPDRRIDSVGMVIEGGGKRKLMPLDEALNCIETYRNRHAVFLR